MYREWIITGLILLAGLINFLPVIGVVSADRLTALYGVDASDPVLQILLRHRAVLFGLLGGFMIASAFHKQLRPIALGGGLVAMLSFMVLFYTTGEKPESLVSIIYADCIGVAAVMGALILDKVRPG